MKIDCIGVNCSECCQRYWITLLPAEAKRIASALKLPITEFIEKKCILIAHIYPAQKPKPLTISTQSLPAKLLAFAKKEIPQLPEQFLVLPSIALKRNAKGNCSLLKKGRCKVYDVAPEVCRLFPFISIGKFPLRNAYPFCLGLRQPGFEKAKGGLDSKQKKRVNKYFDTVKKKPFTSVWKALPKTAVILLDGEKELKISKKDFIKMLESF